MRNKVPPDSAVRISGRTVPPFPQTDLSHGFCDRYAKGGVAIQDRDAHLNLGHLAVEGARHETLPQQLHAMHPLPGSDLPANHERVRFDAAPTVVSAPVPPECPTQILRCAECVAPVSHIIPFLDFTPSFFRREEVCRNMPPRFRC